METYTDIKGKIQNTTAKLWELIKNSAEKIKELKEENKSVTEQNQLLKNVIDKKDNASLDLAMKNSELINQIKMLNYNLNQKNKQILVLNEKLEFAENENHKFQNAGDIIEEKDRHIDELVLENKSLLKEFQIMDEEKNKAEIMLDQYENQSRNLSQEYVRLKEEFRILNEKYQNINSKISNAETEILDYKVLKNDYEKLKQSYTGLTEKITELSELTKDHTQLRHKMESILKDNKILNIKLAKTNEIKEQNDFLRKDNVNKNFVIHEKQKALDSEKERTAVLENFKHLYNKQQDEIKTLNVIINNYRTKLSEINEKLIKAETEVNVFDAKYDILSKNYENVLAENILYKNIREKYENATMSLNKFKEMYSYKEKLLGNKEIEINQFKAEISSLQNQIVEINNKLSAAKVSTEDFQKENKVAHDEYDKSLAKIEELEQTIAEMKIAKNKLIKDYEIRGEEINTLHLKETELEKRLSYYSDNVKILENQLKSAGNLKEEIDNLKREIQNKNSIITDLNEKNNSLNKKYHRLKEQSDTILNRGESLNLMMQNAGEKIRKHNKLKEHISELEKNYQIIKNENTLKSIELEKAREKTENLENLLKTRYEQITLLENQINKEISTRNEYRAEKLKIAEKIDNYINHIDSLMK